MVRSTEIDTCGCLLPFPDRFVLPSNQNLSFCEVHRCLGTNAPADLKTLTQVFLEGKRRMFLLLRSGLFLCSPINSGKINRLKEVVMRLKAPEHQIKSRFPQIALCGSSKDYLFACVFGGVDTLTPFSIR